MYRPECRPERGRRHPSATRKSTSRIQGKRVWCSHARYRQCVAVAMAQAPSGGIRSRGQRPPKRAAGEALAIQSVAGIDRLWLGSDFVPNLPALATARLWELHGPLLFAQPWSKISDQVSLAQRRLCTKKHYC